MRYETSLSSLSQELLQHLMLCAGSWEIALLSTLARQCSRADGHFLGQHTVNFP